MAFNLKRMKKIASEETPLNREEALNKYNSDWSNTVDKDSIPNLNGLLAEVRGEGNADADETLEAQMDAPRKEATQAGDNLTESQMEKRDSWFPHRQADHYDESIMPPISALAAANDDKFHKAYAKAVKTKGSRLLDKNPGSQMTEDKTTVSRNVPASGSQVQNNPERFKELASLKEADAALYGIYYKAASEDRDVTDQEKKIIAQISDYKKIVLSTGFGGLPPAHPPHVNMPVNSPQSHPDGHPESSFYPDMPEQSASKIFEPHDDSLISELLGDSPFEQMEGSDGHPGFENIHEREKQENGINQQEEVEHDLF